MTLRSIVIHLLAVLLLAPSVRAQEGPDVWHSFAEKLAPGSFVVVTLKDGTTVKGHLIQVADDSLRILPKTRLPVPTRHLGFSNIQSIDPRKEGISPGAKVLLGVGIAGGAIALIAAAALSGMK
jgi:hypothetical protein